MARAVRYGELEDSDRDGIKRNLFSARPDGGNFSTIEGCSSGLHARVAQGCVDQGGYLNFYAQRSGTIQTSPRTPVSAYKEKIVEKPVEKIVYQDRVVEKIVEKPVEKIVYVDKIASTGRHGGQYNCCCCCCCCYTPSPPQPIEGVFGLSGSHPCMFVRFLVCVYVCVRACRRRTHSEYSTLL